MKKPELNIQDFFDLPGAELFNPDSLNKVTAVSADSRNIPPDALFVAINGERFDGHDFINDAIKNGAAAVMINRDRTDLIQKIDIPVIVVEDTVKGLGYVASVWRRKLKAKVIALTGSAGKTTTKEMLAYVLSRKFKVNRTSGNNNNHLGVPFTILSTSNSHEILITELGTNHFGEIKYTAEIASPDFALITNIGHSHLEFLGDKKGVLREKGILFDITAQRKGTIFVNNDDPLLRKYSQKFSRKITYGTRDTADVRGKILNYTEDGYPEVVVTNRNRRLQTVIPSPGGQNAINFFAVCAVAFKLGLKKEEILSGIAAFSNIKGRLNVRRIKDYVLIDDCYNANPDSMRYSISLLSRIKGKRKIAVLGDMFELGEKAPEYHRQLASVVKKAKIDEVFTIGGLMENLFDELDKLKIKARHFVDRQILKDVLEQKDFSGAVVLIKGSRGMRMEEFAESVEGVKN